jgi:ankyrin repeat protein
MDHMSPLACAVFKDCAATADLLLAADSSTLNVRDANGDLPLHLALLEGSAAALQVLLSHGANWFDHNDRNETSFDLYKIVLQSSSLGEARLRQLAQVKLLFPIFNTILPR